MGHGRNKSLMKHLAKALDTMDKRGVIDKEQVLNAINAKGFKDPKAKAMVKELKKELKEKVKE